MPPAILAQLAGPEAELAGEVSARDDTATLLVTADDGGLMGYAVMGFDADDMATVYAARSINSMVARMAMAGIFGAAQVMGAPLRVHDLRGKLRAMARMMGAAEIIQCLDGDGLPMGVFRGV
jgi:hypothetical protein